MRFMRGRSAGAKVAMGLNIAIVVAGVAVNVWIWVAKP